MFHCDESPEAHVSLLTGSPGDEPLGGRFRKLSVGQYDNEAGGQPAFSKCGWGKTTSADQAASLAPFLSPADAKEVYTVPESLPACLPTSLCVSWLLGKAETGWEGPGVQSSGLMISGLLGVRGMRWQRAGGVPIGILSSVSGQQPPRANGLLGNHGSRSQMPHLGPLGAPGKAAGEGSSLWRG